jgi:putative drug exporter of the RND superfamily
MIATPTTGRLGRLGAWTADHRRAVIVAWCAAVLLLGALAPFADRALSGAGYQERDNHSRFPSSHRSPE